MLLGRLLDDDSGRLTVLDPSGVARLVGEAGGARPGDIVRIEVEAEPGGSPRGASCEVLTRYRREVPYPSPGGEVWRLARGAPQRLERLRQRSRLLAALRRFFAEQDFVEIEPPLRVRHPGLEPHLVAAAAGPDRYLITSPEYQLKRLLVAGLERIYSLGKCWRDDEAGPWHLGEFTMLEWYRAYSDVEELMRETEALVRCAAAALGGEAALPPRDQPFARLTVAEACVRWGDVELAGVVEPAELARRLRAAGLDASAEEGFEELLSRLLVERVEPRLAELPAVFLCDYPALVAALARLKADDPSVAERFELYLGGVELANAFGELTDPDEQRRRFEADQAQRAAAGRPVHEIDERFIDALREGMPPAAGIALGVDRLLAVLVGAERIGDTVAFTDDEL